MLPPPSGMSLLRPQLLRTVPAVSSRALPVIAPVAVAQVRQTRLASTQPNYEGHIPLNWFEHGLMFAGAAYQALMHPQRGDMVAAVADLTSGPMLPRLREAMLSSPEGRRILKERPRINTHTVDMHKLALLPEGTFGKAYVTWLERCNVTPDTREPVRLLFSGISC
ncbi:hypothetical protein NM688_g8880 [Phlebia brevispora]|uniref:Uncharacterized protein n=1 Tax=Phlebia brevispora TaxID=194682 RepID=A0ACC1RPH8_9APHY|nr:hypothetical protein NM688_g8880 [Phlebia brevispora]